MASILDQTSTTSRTEAKTNCFLVLFSCLSNHLCVLGMWNQSSQSFWSVAITEGGSGCLDTTEQFKGYSTECSWMRVQLPRSTTTASHQPCLGPHNYQTLTTEGRLKNICSYENMGWNVLRSKEVFHTSDTGRLIRYPKPPTTWTKLHSLFQTWKILVKGFLRDIIVIL